jgi:hypothetical protein
MYRPITDPVGFSRLGVPDFETVGKVVSSPLLSLLNNSD